MRPAFLIIPLLAAATAAAAAPVATAVLETRWTKAAEQAFVSSLTARAKKQLPELRVYDAGNRLVLRSYGFKEGTAGKTIVKAVRSRKAVAGPDFAETMGELETRDGRPALAQARGRAKITVVDYWAEWCAPCKALGKELDEWAARQPAGYVQIVHAETDPIAAGKARGQKFFRYIKGPDGKRIKVEA
jgi:thiol-disulfide isomerase/thioredoxin